MNLIVASSRTRIPSWFTICLIWFLYCQILQAEWKKRVFLSPRSSQFSSLCLSWSSSNCSQCCKSAFRFLSFVCHSVSRVSTHGILNYLQFLSEKRYLSSGTNIFRCPPLLYCFLDFLELHNSLVLGRTLNIDLPCCCYNVFETLALQPIIKELEGFEPRVWRM